jgi:hypothetical protein
VGSSESFSTLVPPDGPLVHGAYGDVNLAVGDGVGGMALAAADYVKIMSALELPSNPFLDPSWVGLSATPLPVTPATAMAGVAVTPKAARRFGAMRAPSTTATPSFCTAATGIRFVWLSIPASARFPQLPISTI